MGVADDRYSRQIAFREIGEDGQKLISSARIAVVGIGALGSASANNLARAGAGCLRLIDGDTAEITNLQRQLLYTEADAAASVPKAVAAAEHLRAVNSGIEIEPRVERLSVENCSELLSGVDLVIDGTDNITARYIMNAHCRRLGIPWVYGAALGSTGAVFPVIPDGACFRCLFPEDNSTGESCVTNGVLASLTMIVSSLQVTQAMKILLGKPSSGLITFDIWNNTCECIDIERDSDCPDCGGNHI